MLDNTYRKLREGALKIVYFGASITEGASASDHDLTSWRALSAGWFAKTYPECDIKPINSSIGGTGSDFAVFRLEEDVISHSPDLVFVEFCTNDTLINDCAVYEETIIRRIRGALPLADIVMVRLMQKKMYEKSLRGEFDESYISYERLARRYRLPLLDLGEALCSRIRGGEGDFGTYTKDGVHPNDLGHRILADAAISFLKANIGPGGEPRKAVPPLTGDKYMTARLVRAASVDPGDFSVSGFSFYSDHGCLTAAAAGKKLCFEFSGPVIGIVYQIAHDTGDLLWSVDGGPETRLSTWDEYTRIFDRTAFSILSDDLAPGRHTLTVICAGEKDERSAGTDVRISDFMTV